LVFSKAPVHVFPEPLQFFCGGFLVYRARDQIPGGLTTPPRDIHKNKEKWWADTPPPPPPPLCNLARGSLCWSRARVSCVSARGASWGQDPLTTTVHTAGTIGMTTEKAAIRTERPHTLRRTAGASQQTQCLTFETKKRGNQIYHTDSTAKAVAPAKRTITTCTGPPI